MDDRCCRDRVCAPIDLLDSPCPRWIAWCAFRLTPGVVDLQSLQTRDVGLTHGSADLGRSAQTTRAPDRPAQPTAISEEGEDAPSPGSRMIAAARHFCNGDVHPVLVDGRPVYRSLGFPIHLARYWIEWRSDEQSGTHRRCATSRVGGNSMMRRRDEHQAALHLDERSGRGPRRLAKAPAAEPVGPNPIRVAGVQSSVPYRGR